MRRLEIKRLVPTREPGPLKTTSPHSIIIRVLPVRPRRRLRIASSRGRSLRRRLLRRHLRLLPTGEPTLRGQHRAERHHPLHRVNSEPLDRPYLRTALGHVVTHRARRNPHRPQSRHPVRAIRTGKPRHVNPNLDNTRPVTRQPHTQPVDQSGLHQRIVQELHVDPTRRRRILHSRHPHRRRPHPRLPTVLVDIHPEPATLRPFHDRRNRRTTLRQRRRHTAAPQRRALELRTCHSRTIRDRARRTIISGLSRDNRRQSNRGHKRTHRANGKPPTTNNCRTRHAFPSSSQTGQRTSTTAANPRKPQSDPSASEPNSTPDRPQAELTSPRIAVDEH